VEFPERKKAAKIAMGSEHLLYREGTCTIEYRKKELESPL
jgi:hypothetical protein